MKTEYKIFKIFGIDKMFNDNYERATFKSFDDAMKSLRSNEWIECVEIESVSKRMTGGNEA